MANGARTLLCVPPQGYLADRWRGGKGMPSLGVLSVAAYLEQQGRDVHVLDAHARGMDYRGVAESVARDKPDLFGVTVTSENRLEAFRLVREVRAAYAGARIVAGGPHCFFTDDDTLVHLPEVDYVVRGEGELTALELVDAIEGRRDLRSVAGLSFREGGQVVRNPARPPIPDLDALPTPARHLIDMDDYRLLMEVPGKGEFAATNLITSRGCPFHCNFCATPRNWGRNVRGRSPEKVLEEVELLVAKHGARLLWFHDDTFNYNPRRLDTICRMLVERQLGIHWACQLRVDLVTRESFELMARAGMYQFGFGIESANERLCREVIHRRPALQEAEQVTRWAQELGVTPNPFFIFSHPTETYEEAKESLRCAQSFRGRARCSVAVLHVYPGTELHQRAVEEGKLPADFSWTSEDDRRIPELPEAQGRIPLYKDRLSWYQIARLLFAFNESAHKVSLADKIGKLLRNRAALRNVRVYATMAVAYLVGKLEKRLGPRFGERADALLGRVLRF